MRRVLFLALTTSAIALTACPSPPKNGECKSSKDCADQTGFGKVCVDGRCAECGADTDCKDGFTCQAGKCAPKPAPVVAGPVSCASDAACPAGDVCLNGVCAARVGECMRDTDCPAGKACQGNACVATVDPACADPAAFTVHFGFDKSDVVGDAPAVLQKLAGCLQKSPVKSFEVDGHCDERGTTQYNLALGKRRAEAVKKYLGDLGYAGPVTTNTFGKERPLCRDSNEECWAKNRRAETTFAR